MKKIIIILLLFQFNCLHAQVKGVVTKNTLDTVYEEIVIPEDIVITKDSGAEVPIENRFQIVEQMPIFPGGEVAMMKYVRESIVYPKEEQEKGISGVCYIIFVVEKDGSINGVKVVKGVAGGPECDKEAIRIVKSMPKWTPGIAGGRNVPIQMNLPVKFEIKK